MHTHTHACIHSLTHTYKHTHSHTCMHTHSQKCFITRHPSSCPILPCFTRGGPWQPLAQCPPHILPAPHLSGPHIANPRHHMSHPPSLWGQRPRSGSEGPTASPTGPTSSTTQMPSLGLPHANQRVQGTSPASPGASGRCRGVTREPDPCVEGPQGPLEPTVSG